MKINDSKKKFELKMFKIKLEEVCNCVIAFHLNSIEIRMLLPMK